jgi:hypothetical protein
LSRDRPNSRTPPELFPDKIRVRLSLKRNGLGPKITFSAAGTAILRQTLSETRQIARLPVASLDYSYETAAITHESNDE